MVENHSSDNPITTMSKDVKKDTLFFSVTSRRLVLFSFISLGLYHIFWFYKNWQAVREAEGSRISPIARGFFAIIFCFSLFNKILLSACERGYRSRYTAQGLGTIYILSYIAGRVGNEIPIEFVNPLIRLFFDLILIMLSFSAVVPLIIVQRAIRFNNEQITGTAHIHTGFSKGEILILIIGVLFWLLSGFVYYFS